MYSFGGEIGSKHAFGVEERSHVRLMFYLATTVATSLYTLQYTTGLVYIVCVQHDKLFFTRHYIQHASSFKAKSLEELNQTVDFIFVFWKRRPVLFCN